MNKNAIQKFAIWARNELIAQVSQRAYQYGIDESGFGDASADTLNGRLLTAEEKSQRQELIKQIKEKGYKQVMEEVAYTWFNRFIALRFMEVNNYLPSHIRVFSDASGAFKPEILNDVLHLDLPGLDSGKVAEYIESNDTEALYRYLLLTQCNALNSALPVMFERMGGYTEMLLPNNILRQDSVLGHMVSDIPEEDWQDAVQIIGWLYQYYNTELKDDTFAQLKKNVKITKERIPAATQLFTPDWIVRYMVENSLGRLWLEGHPNAELHDGWKYYLDEAEQEQDVEAQLAKLREEYKTIKPEEIKVIDPCMGSGHILVYAFDVLMQIYTSAGWDQREAAQSILKNNLYGLDIDDRAAQLAYFAVMMKARQYDRRLLTRGIQPNIYSIRESNGINRNQLQFFGWSMGDVERNKAVTQVEYLLDTFRDAKEYGSILNVDMLDWELLYRFAGTVDYSDQISLDELNLEATKDALWTLIEQGAVLAQKYDVVVTNPPYMGSSGMSVKLSTYVKSCYPNSKADMFSCVMEKCMNITKKDRFFVMLTAQSWMFLPSFKELRDIIVSSKAIGSLLWMDTNVWGCSFGTVATCIRNTMIDYAGIYTKITIHDIENGSLKSLSSCKNRNVVAKMSNFMHLPDEPIVFWATKKDIEIFNLNKSVENIGITRHGMTTGNNNRFLRLWHEVDNTKIGFSCGSTESAAQSGDKWFPYNKGGSYRKWFGNAEYVVNYENDGAEVKEFTSHLPQGTWVRIMSREYYFKRSVTWSICGGTFGVRYCPTGSIFDVGGSSLFPYDENKFPYVLGLLNSKVASFLLDMLNPTVNMQTGNLKNVPYIEGDLDKVNSEVQETVSISILDWNAYENSWDFKRNPLV